MDSDPQQTNNTDKPQKTDSGSNDVPNVGQKFVDGIKGGVKKARGAADIAAGATTSASGTGSGGVGGLPGVGSGTPKSTGVGVGNIPTAETGAEPASANNIGDENNPAQQNYKKLFKQGGSKAASKSKSGQRVKQAINDAKEVAKDFEEGLRAFEGDAKAAFDLARRFVSHPVEFVKKYGRIGLYLMGFFLLQTAMVVALFGVIFFGIYKVFLTGMEAITDPQKIVTELNVNYKMAQFLADSAFSLSYERAQQDSEKGGVVIAQEDYENYSLNDVPSNPETDKLYETWSKAGLAETFLDKYNARVEPNGSARQVDSFNPAAWELFVNDQSFGTLDSTRAKAFINLFASKTTHWDAIYTRANYKAATAKSFGVSSYKLNLPKSDGDSNKSDQHITQQLIDTTLKPIDDNSGNYYDCIIKGEASCTNLGLGSQNAPSNSPDEAKLSGFGFIGGFLNNLISRRNEVATNKLDDKVNKGNLGQFTQSISDDITPRASEYENKDTLDAAIRTGSSETILQSIGKSDTEVDTPDPEALLELGQRFVRATTNGNFARVNYDRQSKQSVALGSTYFTAGGQLLNNDMGLLESWSLTKNLSVLEESPAFRAAVIGSPIGVFAQDGNNDGYEECQKTYDDDAPIGKVDTNIDRPVQRSSCFRRALIPNENEFAQDRSLKRVYKLLEQNNNEYDNSVSSSGGLGGVIGRIIKSANAEKLGAYRNKSIRTSPIAVEKVNLSSDLGPEFDAYINQVYGVAKTGAEVNGDAYDTMAMAAQAIWTQAALDKDYGIGGKYLDSVETAEISRYARVMKKEKLALTPLSERLLSITTPDSLAGKLALLTPTNKIDGAKKTLALYKTENLSGAIAAHLTPTTLAEAADPVNIFNGVPGGYPLSDPSNTMNAGQLWDTYDCDNGGVNQEVSQPNGIPFDVATTTNPCRRESVVTMVAGCYLDSQASCNLEELNAPETTGVEIDDRGADTSNTPCAAGSTAERLATLQNGAQIKLCDYGAVTGINASWSSDVAAMLQAASGQIELSGNAYRDSANQIELRKKHCGSSQYDIYQKPSGSCRPPTAIPGRSNHEYGLAIDFKNCSNRGTACYQWLAANAGTYNIKNFPKEAWHWSFNGS